MKKKTVGKFLLFNKKHPEVYDAIKTIALKVFTTGKKKYSIWAIVNEVRWANYSDRDSKIRISNNFTPLYARKLIKDYPILKPIFDIKPLKKEID